MENTRKTTNQLSTLRHERSPYWFSANVFLLLIKSETSLSDESSNEHGQCEFQKNLFTPTNFLTHLFPLKKRSTRFYNNQNNYLKKKHLLTPSLTTKS